MQESSLLLKSIHIFWLKLCQSYGFSSSHVRMWELDNKEGRVPKNWCFQTVVLEKTFEIPLNCKEMKPVNPKGNQPWIFIGRTETVAETPILWPPDVKKRLIGGEGGNRGWDGWMASLTQWTWVWVNSGRWWRTGKPGVLQSMGLQRVRRDWATEKQQQYSIICIYHLLFIHLSAKGHLGCFWVFLLWIMQWT